MAQRKASQLRESPRQPLEGFQILDGTMLKLVAMVSMVADHVGDAFFPQATWLRVIGRLAMPIFSFCIAEGYAHTRDRRAYLMRMGVFALVSELPFDLFADGRLDFGHQNILFTFALSICALMAYDWITEQNEGTRGIVLGSIAVVAVGLLSILLRLDYNITVVGLVFVFYVLRDRNPFLRNSAAVAYEALVRNVGIYRLGVLSFFPLMMYNGQRGRGLKLLFYLFYPGHLLLLYLIKLLMQYFA